MKKGDFQIQPMVIEAMKLQVLEVLELSQQNKRNIPICPQSALMYSHVGTVYQCSQQYIYFHLHFVLGPGKLSHWWSPMMMPMHKQRSKHPWATLASVRFGINSERIQSLSNGMGPIPLGKGMSLQSWWRNSVNWEEMKIYDKPLTAAVGSACLVVPKLWS